MSNFSDLDNMILQFPTMLEMLSTIKQTLDVGTIEKRWLSTQDVADYTPYKLETIKAKVKNSEFIEGVH